MDATRSPSLTSLQAFAGAQEAAAAASTPRADEPPALVVARASIAAPTQRGCLGHIPAILALLFRPRTLPDLATCPTRALPYMNRWQIRHLPCGFLSLPVATRQALATQVAYFSPQQVQQLVDESDDAVLAILLPKLTCEQLRELRWPDDGKNYADAIAVNELQPSQDDDILDNYMALTYTFQSKSLIQKGAFQAWIRRANAEQFLAILTTIRCFDQLQWALEVLSLEQQSALKELYRQMDEKKEFPYTPVFGLLDFDRSVDLLNELAKVQPALFEEICFQSPLVIPRALDALYHAPQAVQDRLLDAYIEQADGEQLEELILRLARQVNDTTYLGCRTRLRFAMLIDKTLEKLANSSKASFLPQALQGCRVYYGINEFLVPLLVAYDHSTGQGSLFYAQCLQNLARDKKLLVAFLEAFWDSIQDDSLLQGLEDELLRHVPFDRFFGPMIEHARAYHLSKAYLRWIDRLEREDPTSERIPRLIAQALLDKFGRDLLSSQVDKVGGQVSLELLFWLNVYKNRAQVRKELQQLLDKPTS